MYYKVRNNISYKFLFYFIIKLNYLANRVGLVVNALTFERKGSIHGEAIFNTVTATCDYNVKTP